MLIRSLEVFVAIVEKGGFSKAAEHLFVGQPALSKSIQKLESELNVTLFDRTTKKAQVTDEGKVLYEKSKDILEKIHQIPEALHRISDHVSGELRIGIPQIIGSVFFPKVAYQFLKQYPKVTMFTKEVGGIIIENLVEQNELDIGFVVLPTLNSLDVTSIFQEEFVLCVSSHHPLAKVDHINLFELKEETFILFDRSFALYNVIRNHCLRAGFSPKVAFQSTQWDLVLELVSAQLGITIIPKILTNKLNGIDISVIKMNDPDMMWNIGMITKKNAYKSHALRKFMEVVNEVYELH